VKFEQKLRYPAKECLKHLGISRNTFDLRVNAGKYQVVRDGGLVFMTHEQLMNAINGGSKPNA